MIEILIECLLAFGTYSIAKNKNRNKVAWAILGFLFGIIALIIVALLPKLEVDRVVNNEMEISEKDNE